MTPSQNAEATRMTCAQCGLPFASGESPHESHDPDCDGRLGCSCDAWVHPRCCVPCAVISGQLTSASVDDVCICQHATNEHSGLIVPIEDEPSAYYALLLGSCSTCSCTVFDPGAHCAGRLAVAHERTLMVDGVCPVCGEAES